MKRDSLKNENVKLFSKILKTVEQKVCESQKTFSINDLQSKWSAFQLTKEKELYEAIGWGLRNGILSKEESRTNGKDIFRFSRDPLSIVASDESRVAVSTPPLTNFGLQRTLSRYDFINTREAFREIIESTKEIIRISSPFFEKNVIDNEALPEFPDLISSALDRGCELRLVSRQVKGLRISDLNWLIELAKKQGKMDQLKLFDYYVENDKHSIISSIHAKMVIADYSLAYIGSAEIRRNSISKNFEVGILIRGPSVWGLAELFDLMTVYSKELI